LDGLFVKRTVGECLEYWVSKAEAVLNKILSPILKALQFDKLFDPIKKIIIKTMAPFIEHLTLKKFVMPQMPTLVDFPDMFGFLDVFRGNLKDYRVNLQKVDHKCGIPK